MTDISDISTASGRDDPDVWLKPLFVRSNLALDRMAPDGHVQAVSVELLRRSSLRRMRVRMVLTGLMFGGLGTIAGLLASLGAELLGQAELLLATWGDAALFAAGLSCLALCAVAVRIRTA